MSLRFLRVEASALDGVVDLARAIHGEGFFTDVAYFRWRYFDSAFGPGALMGAFEGDRAVGLLGWTAVPIRDEDGRDRVAGLVGDAMTRPEVRHVLFRESSGEVGSVFTRLYRMAEEAAWDARLSWLYTFPNALSRPFFVRRFGYAHVGDLSFAARPLRIAPYLLARGVPHRLARPLGAGVKFAYDAGSPARRPREAREVVALADGDPAIDEVWRRLAPAGPIVARTARYVGWRTAFRRMDVICARDASGPAAYAALVRDRYRLSATTEARTLTVADLLAGDEASATALLEVADRRARAADLDAVLYIGTLAPPIRGALSRAGFTVFGPRLLGKDFPLFVRRWPGAEPSPPPRLTHTTIADNDVV